LSENDTPNTEVNKDEKEDAEDSQEGKNGIVSTEEEMEGYPVVKAILREMLDVTRIVMRDTKSYCGILLDNNNRKSLCRLHFNYSQKYLGIISEKGEERVVVDSVDDIYKYSEQIKATALEYEQDQSVNK